MIMTEPCSAALTGKIMLGRCPSCGHLVGAHDSDRVCETCETEERLRSTMRDVVEYVALMTAEINPPRETVRRRNSLIGELQEKLKAR